MRNAILDVALRVLPKEQDTVASLGRSAEDETMECWAATEELLGLVVAAPWRAQEGFGGMALACRCSFIKELLQPVMEPEQGIRHGVRRVNKDRPSIFSVALCDVKGRADDADGDVEHDEAADQNIAPEKEEGAHREGRFQLTVVESARELTPGCGDYSYGSIRRLAGNDIASPFRGTAVLLALRQRRKRS